MKTPKNAMVKTFPSYPQFFNKGVLRRMGGMALLAMVVLVGRAWAITYSWNQTGAGPYYWTNSANWTPGGYPNAVDDFANLSQNLTANQTIVVDVPITLGHLALGDTTGPFFYQSINTGVAGAFTFSSSSGKGSITKHPGNVGILDVIFPPITVAADLYVSNFSTGRIFFTANMLQSGTRGLWIEGGPQGTNVLGGSNAFGKGVVIKSGTVLLTNFVWMGNNNRCLGAVGVTNDGTLIYSATNDLVNSMYYGFGSYIAGSGTNILLPSTLGVPMSGTTFSGNSAGFTGAWFVNPEGATNVGPVNMWNNGNDNPAASWHVFTNSSLDLYGTATAARIFTYGGNPVGGGQLSLASPHTLSGDLTVSGEVTNGVTLYSVGPDTNRISGIIRETNGAWGVSVNGSGPLVFQNTNLYSGGTLARGGVLVAGCPGVPNGSGPFGTNAMLTFSNVLASTLDLGGYDVRLMGIETRNSGSTRVNLGTNQLTLGGDFANPGSFNGFITGTGSFRKVGTNAINLFNPTNNYSGGTVFEGGILQVGSNAALGSGPVIISNQAVRLGLRDGTLLTNDFFIFGGNVPQGRGLVEMPVFGTATLTNGTVTISGTLGSGGHFSSGGSNSSVLRLMGPIQATVAVTHRSGRVELGGGGSYPTYTVMNSNAVLVAHQGLAANSVVALALAANNLGSNFTAFDLGGFNQTLMGITNHGAASNFGVVGNSSTTSDSTLTLTGNSLFDGLVVDRLAGGNKKLGLVVNGGTVTLSGTNTYSGKSTVALGTLRAGVATVLHRGAFGSNSSVVLSNQSGAILDLNGWNTEIGSLMGGGASGGDVTLGSGTLTVVESSTNTFIGMIQGTGGFAKSGNGRTVLSGSNSFTGATAVNAGALQVEGTLTQTGTVSVAAGAELAGSGSVGALTLASGASVSPGSNGVQAGTLTVASADLQSGSIYRVEMDGAGNTSDRLSSAGTVTLAGTLVLTNYANPTNNALFTLVSAATVTGTFTGLTNGARTNCLGRLLQVNYSPTNVTLFDLGATTSVSCTNPLPYSICTGVINLSGTATNADPNLSAPSIYVSSNGGIFKFIATGYAWSTNFDTTLLPDGTNTATFLGVSPNFYTNRLDLPVIVDNTPPPMPVITSTTNQFYTTLSVTLTATDPWGISNIYYTLDGSLPSASSAFVANGASVTVNDTCVLTARAVDLAGNWGPTNQAAFGKIPNPTGTGSISVMGPNPFKPGETPLTLSITRTTTDSVDLLIIDMEGRLVAELKSSSPSVAYKNDYTWDGRGRDGKTVGFGLYRVVPRVKGVVREDMMRKLYVR